MRAKFGIQVLELQIIVFVMRGKNEDDVCHFGVGVVYSGLSFGSLRSYKGEIASRSSEVVANGPVLEEGVLVVVVVSVIVDIANVYDHEVVGEVLPKHEEDSIISQIVTHFQLLLSAHLRPKRFIIIRSPPFPLLTAPRVTQLQQPVWLMENLQLNYKSSTMV